MSQNNQETTKVFPIILCLFVCLFLITLDPCINVELYLNGKIICMDSQATLPPPKKSQEAFDFYLAFRGLLFWRWFSQDRVWPWWLEASGAQVGRLRTQSHLLQSPFLFCSAEIQRSLCSAELRPWSSVYYAVPHSVSCRQVSSVHVSVCILRNGDKTLLILWEQSLLFVHRSSECWHYSDSQIDAHEDRATCDNEMYSGYETWLHVLVPTRSRAGAEANLLLVWCWHHWQRRHPWGVQCLQITHRGLLPYSGVSLPVPDICVLLRQQ